MAITIRNDFKTEILRIRQDIQRVCQEMQEKRDYIDELRGEVGCLEDEYLELEDDLADLEKAAEGDNIPIQIELRHLVKGLQQGVGYFLVYDNHEIQRYTEEAVGFLVMMGSGSIYAGHGIPHQQTLLSLIRLSDTCGASVA